MKCSCHQIHFDIDRHGIHPKQRISFELGKHLSGNSWLNKSKVVDHSYTKPQSAFGGGKVKWIPPMDLLYAYPDPVSVRINLLGSTTQEFCFDMAALAVTALIALAISTILISREQVKTAAAH